MSWKESNKCSLFDTIIVEHKALYELDKIDNLLDWQKIKKLLRGIYSSKMGNKAYCPLKMFKALLLQNWYNLSDEQLEKQLARDLVFRRFVGISLSESIPDHSTIWRFRQELGKKNLGGKLLLSINEQLWKQGLRVKEGVSIVDATVVEAQRCREKKNKKGESTVDQESSYSVKCGSRGKQEVKRGYKMHVNVDKAGYVVKVRSSGGSEHDSKQMESLLTGDEKEVYGDSAYRSKEREAYFKEKGVVSKILYKGVRGRSLSVEEKIQNRDRSRVRSVVERVFGLMKLHQGLGKARYLGLLRNSLRFILIAISYNLKRARGILQKRELLVV